MFSALHFPSFHGPQFKVHRHHVITAGCSVDGGNIEEARTVNGHCAGIKTLSTYAIVSMLMSSEGSKEPLMI